MHPTKISLEECGTHREVIVSLRPHLPVRNRPVVIDIRSEESSRFLKKICIRGASACQIVLTSRHSIHTPLRIKLFAACELPSNGESNEVSFRFGSIRRGGYNAFWNMFQLPEIKVRAVLRMCPGFVIYHRADRSCISFTQTVLVLFSIVIGSEYRMRGAEYRRKGRKYRRRLRNTCRRVRNTGRWVRNYRNIGLQTGREV